MKFEILLLSAILIINAKSLIIEGHCKIIPEHYWSLGNYYEKARLLGITSQRFFNPYMSSKTEELIYNLKKELQPKLTMEDWEEDYQVIENLRKKLFLNPPVSKLNITNANIEDMTVEDFIQNYQSKQIPVMLHGLLKGIGAEKWTFKVDFIKNLIFRAFMKHIKIHTLKLSYLIRK